MVYKGLLNRMECISISESFNSDNLLILRLNGQCQAGKNKFPVQDDIAAATVPFIAHFFGTGKAERFPENFKERPVGLYLYQMMVAIYDKFHFLFHYHVLPIKRLEHLLMPVEQRPAKGPSYSRL